LCGEEGLEASLFLFLNFEAPVFTLLGFSETNTFPATTLSPPSLQLSIAAIHMRIFGKKFGEKGTPVGELCRRWFCQ
jgi:hypothetical protein